MLKILCTVLLIVSCLILVDCRSYNNGLIFYNLENHNTYLPPTISVSRGRGLAKFQYSARGSIWSTFGKPCDCEGPLCGCCVGIKVKQYNFDQKMCANVSYVRPKDEIQMEVFLNDTATAKYGIAARNPSPLCVPIMMGIPMSMCVQMSNIAVQGDNLNMCMDFLVRLASTQLFEMHFQCMKVGLQGASWVGPNGQPVIPESESKLKDGDANESEEYYDEAEKENEVISKEKEELKESDVMNMQGEEEDLNKAEEEMDDNDIADKVMDIVKEQELEEEEMKESSELMKENEIEGLSPMQDHNKVEEIVTNIMESINEGKDSEDSDKYITMTIVVANIQPNEMATEESVQESNVLTDPISLEAQESNMESIMETNALVDSDFQIKTPEINDNEEIKEVANEVADKPLQEETDSLKLEINDLKDSPMNTMEMEESNEINKNQENLQDFPSLAMKDELHLEDLFENSPEKDMQIENNVEQPQSDVVTMKTQEIEDKQTTDKESMIEMLEETTEHDYETGNVEKFEMLINNEGGEESETEISQIDNELNNSLLENLQPAMETSTERLMAANLKPTMPQIVAATTSETDSIDSIDNTLTTATIVTTTKTTSATKKPTVLAENSAVAVTFIKNTDDNDKTNNNDEEEDGNGEEDGDNGDNSHENDSDYDDEEESEESEDETTEKGIQTNDAIATATTIVIPTKAVSKQKESSTTENQANASNSNESDSKDDTNENTKDEFEAVEEQEEVDEEEADADEEVSESNEQNENDAEEEYDDEYEDYETTTEAVNDTNRNSANDTCCKSATSASLNDMQATTTNEQLNVDTNTVAASKLPQTNTATSNNLQFVSNTNTVISNGDSNMLNVESTTSKMSQITVAPAAATIAVSSTTISSSSNSNSNAMPLPLARKLFAHHHHEQQNQQQQHHQQHYYQQYHRHSRQQRQHYV